MLQAISSLKDDLAGMLNSSAFSTDSIEGWIIIILVLFIIYEISRKALDFVGWLVGVLFLFQVCHWMSYTGLGKIIPFAGFFKYDLLTAVAQCFVGTKLCDTLLYANSFIQVVCNGLWEFMSKPQNILRWR